MAAAFIFIITREPDLGLGPSWLDALLITEELLSLSESQM
jgi:hypothetical protein